MMFAAPPCLSFFHSLSGCIFRPLRNAAACLFMSVVPEYRSTRKIMVEMLRGIGTRVHAVRE